MSNIDEKPVQLWCNRCQNDTWHDRLTCRSRQFSDELVYDDGTPAEMVVTWTVTSDVFACRGCDEVTIRRTEGGQEPDEESVAFFPPRLTRRKPRWTWQEVPLTVHSLHNEVYTALQAGAFQLAAMGTRTLLDMLLDDAVGNHGTFNARVEAMAAAGHLSAKQQDVLLATLDFGSAAAHRGYRPRETHLMAALDVVEYLLHARYVQPAVADRLRKIVPPRPSRPTRPPA